MQICILIIFYCSIFAPYIFPHDASANGVSYCGYISLSEFDNTYTKINGHYSNLSYGYSITIPSGLEGMSQQYPQHGFVILFSDKSNGFISVECNANSLEWRSLHEAATSHVEYISESSKKIISSQEKDAKLGVYSATRIVVDYECDDISMVADSIIYIDNRQLVYNISLVSEKSQYIYKKDILERIADTFTIEPRR